ncbi:hypothetical protein CQA09_29470, partial [Klebsiella pneumoniae]
MPSSFLRYAADGDGDGRIDIWNNIDDVFASTASYLSKEGCQFMPSSFLRYAADGDGDGRIDIWNNIDDVFAS